MSSNAPWSLRFAASSSTSETGIGTAGPTSATFADARGVARRAFEDRERAQRVADERGLVDPRRVEHRGNPVGDRLDRRQRAAAGTAVARQVDGEHVPAVMREIARLQRPDAVVVPRAVDEDDRRQRGIERRAPVYA